MDLAQTNAAIQQEATAFRGAGSEAIMQAIGGLCNFLRSCNSNIKLNYQIFNTAGSHTWNAPANLNGGMALVIGRGGSAGGGGSSGGGVAGAGGGGSASHFRIAFFTASTAYTMSIGNKGTGGAANSPGSNGGSTTMNYDGGGSLTFRGALGGAAAGGTPGQGYGLATDGGNATSTRNGVFAVGGGTSGGGAGDGAGGASGNPGANGVDGGGGGGGSGVSHSGGDGTVGQIIVVWFETQTVPM